MMGRGRRQKPQSRLNNRKTEWIPAGLGFALFLPYFLAFWPGVSTPDSIWQLRQAMHLTNYQNQHPFLHTLMIELCYRIGSTAAGALHDFTGGRLFPICLIRPRCMGQGPEPLIASPGIQSS